MSSLSNSFSRSYEQRFDRKETQYYPEPIRTCGNGLRPDPFVECSGSHRSSKSCIYMFGGMEESEVVDVLQQILVDCVKKADIRGQKILLRKFFSEIIEKEIPLQRFLVERLTQSKISSLFDNIPTRDDDDEFFQSKADISTRELNVCEGETSEKMERFKVRTVQVGVVVKEETSQMIYSI